MCAISDKNGYTKENVLYFFEGLLLFPIQSTVTNLSCLTGSSASRRSPKFLRSVSLYMGAANAPSQGHALR